MAWVFAYGSLVADNGREAVPCSLHGHRRVWGVAMDNRVDLPAYKHYLDEWGERPAVYVAFLDLEPAPGVTVNGAAIPVDDAELPALDARERNYTRLAVDGGLDVELGGEVYTYVGSEAGRGRLRAGLAARTAVIHAAYRDNVLRGFEAAGQLEAFVASTAPEPCPVRALTRVDH